MTSVTTTPPLTSDPPTTPSSSPPPPTTPSTTQPPPPPSSTSTPPPPPPSSTETPPPPPSSTETPPPPVETTTAPTAPPSTSLITSVFTTTDGNSQVQVTQVVTVTSPAPNDPNQQPTGVTEDPASSSTSNPAALQSGGAAGPTQKGLTPGGKTAIAVVVPVVVVALLVIAGIWLWRKRKQRKSAEEARRKEVEDYGYNPNNDPTLPAVMGAVGGSQMTEDSSGYRGWGNTTTASNGRKTSTTVSGGVATFSDTGSNQGGYRSPGSPTHGPSSDAGNSGDPLVNRRTMDSDGIGALGAAPLAGANRTDIRRGPSNASSSYSVGNRSEDSDSHYPMPIPQDYYTENAYYQPGPYGETNNYSQAQQPQQPIIRDVSARRNTRIESPAVFPHQGNSGIAQNF